MKTLIKTLLTASALATTAMGQVVTPVWVEHLNGQQGMDLASRLPILVHNIGAHENNNGLSQMVSFGKLLPYDSTRNLLYIRENGIDETAPHDPNVAAAFPDRSLIWINAATGAPWIPPGHTNAVAFTFGVIPIPITGQASQYDYFAEWGMDADGNLYYGHKNKILRYAKTATDTWSTVPTCAWTEPTVGAEDCNGNLLDGSSNGDGNNSIRWREFRVTGSGTNTVLFCGGGTWRMDNNPQIFTTTNGINFNPVGRLDNRDNGAGKNSYSLGGQSTHVVQYGWDSSRPNLQTVYTGHYPGAGYGNRPNRYETDPDAPAVEILNFSYSGNPLSADDIAAGYTWGHVNVLSREETAAGESQPAFAWEAAGTHGLPEVIPIDGDQYYDGNWSCAMDANASLDYLVNYSMPSWNNQYGTLNGTNYGKPGWIGVHRLDGSIALNSAWRMPCSEYDIFTPDNGAGSDWGYCGDITLVPDTNAPANLKKATVYWSGSAYGFGVFTVQNVPATLVTAPPASISVVEGGSVTLVSAFSGSPNNYSWVSANNGVIDPTVLNADGSLHFPQTVVQGPNTPTLAISQTSVSDSGLYTLTVTNPLSGTMTFNVNLTVLPDTNKPSVVSVAALGTVTASSPGGKPSLIKVVFSKRMDSTTGSDPSNFHLNNGVTVSGATVQSDPRAASLGADWRVIILQTSGLTPGAKYSLTVSGVRDQASTPNTITTASFPLQAPILTTGVVNWDYWYEGSSGLGTLYGLPIYPSAPMTNQTFAAFDTTPFTHGDLNGNTAFGSLGDNYGDSLSGWITPTVSGQYYFFVASDDASDLYLSSDANPGNVAVIAQEPGCCHGFVEPGTGTQTSGLISLVAGTPYFLQAVHAEGGGGDYVKVAWRFSTDTNAAATLPPISGSVLSAYASVPLPSFGVPVLTGTTVTIPWTSYNAATVLQSTDLKTWTPVTGNPNPIVVTSTTGAKQFFRLELQ